MTAFQKTVTILIFVSSAAAWLSTVIHTGGPEGVEDAILTFFCGLLLIAFLIAGTANSIATLRKKTFSIRSQFPLLLALLAGYGTIATPFIIGARNSARSHTVQFSNLSANTFTSARLDYPGFGFDFGHSGPLVGASYSPMITEVPAHARLIAEIEGEGTVELNIDFTAALEAWNHRDRLDTLHIVIARDGSALGLIETRSDDYSYIDGTLYPFEGDSGFRQYRELAAACYKQDVQRAGNLVLDGAPVEWDDPVVMSPLEWACAHGLPKIAALILEERFEDLSHFRLSHCYQLAAQNNDVEILAQLVAAFPAENIRS